MNKTEAEKNKKNLMNADLQDTDLRGADLMNAYLRGADLRGANLTCANLHSANLRRADLMYANLHSANLRGADLRDANLRFADLRDANLRGADLKGAHLRCAHGVVQVCPETGSFECWKKCRDEVLVKLLVPHDAQRSSATNRKCRASHVIVLDVIDAYEGISEWDASTRYRVGDTVHCDKWDTDRWTECGGGIHFFITKQEAIDY